MKREEAVTKMAIGLAVTVILAVLFLWIGWADLASWTAFGALFIFIGILLLWGESNEDYY